MARPKSMPDFSHLFASGSPSPVIAEKERARKKPSISLAAGLIMNSESPKSIPNTPANGKGEDGLSNNLFYAYAQKSDSSLLPPYILTFANASIANQWWEIAKSEYPHSIREGPQLFILQSDDTQQQIQDNPRFYDLRNKWFYTACDGNTGVIPLQDEKGNPIASGTSTAAGVPDHRKRGSIPGVDISKEEKTEPAFDMSSLSATLDKMSAMISENSAQIKALSVAQSEGLQRMQEINESNSTQIKALADSQVKLQGLMNENASHFIALSNTSFSNQEQVKSVLQKNAEQIKALANGQSQLAATCADMMKSVSKMSEGFTQLASHADNGSSPAPPFSAMAGRISPAPRKLNRRIKGVWYEYAGDASPQSSPRGSVLLQTPPKSPVVSKRVSFSDVS